MKTKYIELSFLQMSEKTDDSESATDINSESISDRRSEIHEIDGNPANLCRVYYYTRRWTLKNGQKQERVYAMHRFINNTLDTAGMNLLNEFAKLSPEKMDLFLYKAKLLRKHQVEKGGEEDEK